VGAIGPTGIREAHACGAASVITTEKDAVKLAVLQMNCCRGSTATHLEEQDEFEHRLEAILRNIGEGDFARIGLKTLPRARNQLVGDA